MLSLSKLLARTPISLAADCFCITASSSGHRNLYTPAYFGIPGFQNYCVRTDREQGANLASLRAGIEQSIAKSEAKVFTEDLKTFLYLVKNDSDLELLFQAIKKYQTQDSLNVFSFNFEIPLVKLLIKLNKLDKAVDVLTNNDLNLKHFHRARITLLNTLFTEKRFAEGYKFASTIISSRPASETRPLGLEISNMVGCASLEANTKEAYEQTKVLLKQIDETKSLFQTKGVVAFFLAALEQNDLETAFELSSRNDSRQQNVYKNLKIIALSKLNRLTEALNETRNLFNMRVGLRGFNIFPDTIEALNKAVLKSENNELKTSFDEISLKFTNERRLARMTLREFALNLIDIRRDVNAIDNNNNNFNNNNQQRPQRFGNNERNPARDQERGSSLQQQRGGELRNFRNQRQNPKFNDNENVNDLPVRSGSYDRDNRNLNQRRVRRDDDVDEDERPPARNSSDRPRRRNYDDDDDEESSSRGGNRGGRRVPRDDDDEDGGRPERPSNDFRRRPREYN